MSVFQAIIVHWYAIFALSITGLLFSFYLVLRLQTREARKYINRVGILKLRDELRFHVAMNRLAEQSDLYRHYDALANALVRDAENYSAYRLVRAVRKFGKEILSKNQSELSHIHRMLSEAEPEVQKTVGELYFEIARLFVRQSKAILGLAFLVIIIQKGCSLLFNRKLEKSTGDLAAPAFLVKNAKHLGQQWVHGCA